MNKRTLSVKRLWFEIGLLTVNASCLIALFLSVSFFLHRSVEKTLRTGTAETASFDQRILNEKDPGKLRHQVIALWDSVMECEKTNEIMLRWMIEMAALFGFILLINNVVLGTRMHRFLRHHDSTTVS